MNRRPVEDRILDAAASCVLAYGVDRVTLAEIARRAGVSRPTVYRRWPDTRSILAALLTARITACARRRAEPGRRPRGAGRARSSRSPTGCAHDDVVMSVLHQAPDLAMVYIAERLGTSQQILLDAVAGEIEVRPGRGQRAGRRRPPAGRDVPADHPVDDPVGADGRADPRRRARWPSSSPTP